MKFANVMARLSLCFLGLVLVLFADASWALKISAVTSNVTTAMGSTAKVLQSVALLSGIGFIMVSFFKFHQHKLNPTQTPLSQGLAMLVIGAGLVLFPTLIPTAESVISGTTGKTAQISGSTISGLIGSK
jgi:intracellular multiplication protein IcmD